MKKNAEEKILKKLKFRKTQKNSIMSFIVSLNFISIFSIALIFTFYFVLTSLNQTVNQSELQMEILDVEKLIENIYIQEEIEVIEW